MIDVARLVRNSLFMSGNVVVSGLIVFLTMVLIARYLGVALFGDFVFVLTIASLFQLAVDGGIINITIREMTRAKDRIADILSASRLFLWLVTVLVVVLIVLAAELSRADPHLKATLYLMGVAALVNVHGLIFTAVMRAHDDMGLVALTGFAHKVLLLLAVGICIGLDSGIEGVSAAHLFANAVQWLVLSTLVARRYTPSRLRYDPVYWRFLIREAVPLGFGMLMRKMTVHVGTLLLVVFSTSTAVGLFGSAYRVLQMVEVAALTLASVLFPALSRLAQESRDDFERFYAVSLRLLMLISAVAGFWFLAAGNEVVVLLYGPDFLPAGEVLSVLGFALICLVPGSLFYAVFAALGRQKQFMIVAAVSLFANVSIGAALIPFIDFIGAAYAACATEILSFVLCVLMLQRQGVRADVPMIVVKLVAVAVVASLPLHLLGIAGDLVALTAATVLYLGLFAAGAVATRLIRFGELAALKTLMRPSRVAP